MNTQIYEILDQFKAATTRQAKIYVLRSNDSKTLRDVLSLAYSPYIQFYTTFLPKMYQPDTDSRPGMGWSHLGVEIRKMYLFVKDHPASSKLSFEKKEELLTQMLESLEPREADVVITIFRKELASDLTKDLVDEAFPHLLG